MGMPPPDQLPAITNTAQAKLGDRWKWVERRTHTIARREAGWQVFKYQPSANEADPTMLSVGDPWTSHTNNGVYDEVPGARLDLTLTEPGLFQWLFYVRIYGCGQGRTWLEANDGFQAFSGWYGLQANWGTPDDSNATVGGWRFGQSAGALGFQRPMGLTGNLWSFPMLGPGDISIRTEVTCHPACPALPNFFDFTIYYAVV